MGLEDEVSLGEPSEASVEDLEGQFEEAVEKFDVQKFLEGARSARVTVRLYARPDLDARITKERTAMFEAMQAGNQMRVKACEREINALQDAFFRQALDVTLEERSREWQARKRLELKNAGVSDERRIVFELIAAQMLEPNRFTAEELAGLHETIPGQIKGLVEAWAELSNTDPAGLPVF